MQSDDLESVCIECALRKELERLEVGRLFENDFDNEIMVIGRDIVECSK